METSPTGLSLLRSHSAYLSGSRLLYLFLAAAEGSLSDCD